MAVSFTGYGSPIDRLGINSEKRPKEVLATLSMLTAQRQPLLAIISMACLGCANGMTWPLFSTMLSSQNYSELFIGLSASAQTISLLIVFPTMLPILRLFGLFGTVLLIVFVSTTVLFGMYVFDGSLWIPGRMMLGVVLGMAVVMAETWYMRTMSNQNNGLPVGIFGLLWSLSVASGPAMLLILGTTTLAPFTAVALLVLCGAVVLLGSANETYITQADRKWSMRAVATLTPAVLLLSCILGALDSTSDVFLPIHGIRRGLSTSDSLILLVVLLTGVASAQIPSGVLINRTGSRNVAVGASLLSLLGSLFLYVGDAELDGMIPGVILIGMGAGSLWTAVFAWVQSEVSGDQLTAVNSARLLMYGVGSTIGPTIVGSLSGRGGTGIYPVAIAILAAAAICITVYFRCRRKGIKS